MGDLFMPAPEDNSFIAQEYRKRVAELENPISWFCTNCDSEVLCNPKRMNDLLKQDEDKARREGYEKAEAYYKPQVDLLRKDFFALKAKVKKLAKFFAFIKYEWVPPNHGHIKDIDKLLKQNGFIFKDSDIYKG